MISYSRMTIYFNFARYAFSVSHYETLVWQLHVRGLAGHFGREKTINAVENLFYWPNLK